MVLATAANKEWTCWGYESSVISSGIVRHHPGGLHRETAREVRQRPVPGAPPLDGEAKRRFQAIVGSTMYLSHLTRYGILYAVNQLARPIHQRCTLGETKHILWYLAGTVDFSITYSKEGLGSGLIRAATGVITRTTGGQLRCNVKRIIDIERSPLPIARREYLRSIKRDYWFLQALMIGNR